LWEFVRYGTAGGGYYNPPINPDPAPNPDINPNPTPIPIPDPSIRNYSSEDIATSPIHDGFRFVKGEILISATLDASYTDVYRLMAEHGGVIVGYISIVNEFQVCFGRETTEDELWGLIDVFMGNEIVVLATLNLVGDLWREVPSSPEPLGGWEYWAASFRTYTSPLTASINLPPSNDTIWLEEWDDYWEGMAGGLNWGMEVIEMPRAWEFNELIAQNRSSIGIIDSGFDYRHDDLEFAHVFRGNIDERAGRGAHGTAVAGIIGSQSNNDRGIPGVLWDVDLFAFDTDGITLEPTPVSISGFSLFRRKYAVANLFGVGANIINVSQGLSNRLVQTGLPPYQLEFLSIEGESMGVFLQKYLDIGFDFLIVQSSGNSSISDNHNLLHARDAGFNGMFVNIPYESFPDVFSRIIVVGGIQMHTRFVSTTDFPRWGPIDVFPYAFPLFVPASANRNNPNNFTFYYAGQLGNRVDILAPGRDIFVLSPVSTVTQSDGTTQFVSTFRVAESGTSFAAPYVTGTAGMVWAINPYLTGAEVRDIVINSNHNNMVLTLPEHTPILGGGDNPRRTYPILNAGNAAEEAFRRLNGGENQQSDPPYSFFGRITHETSRYGYSGVFGVGGVTVQVFDAAGIEFITEVVTFSDIHYGTWISGFFYPYESWLTNDIGRFSLILDPGTYTLAVRREGFENVIFWSAVTIEEDGVVEYQEFMLPYHPISHQLIVNGNLINCDLPLIRDYRSQYVYAVSMRTISEAYGFEINWDYDVFGVVIESDNWELRRIFPAGSNIVHFEIRDEYGQWQHYTTHILPYGAAPFLYEGRMYLRHDLMWYAANLESSIITLHQGVFGGAFSIFFRSGDGNRLLPFDLDLGEGQTHEAFAN
jgi:subtilisin family serine protease